MSTDVEHGEYKVSLIANPNPAYPNIGVEASGDSVAGRPYAVVPRADFLAAVETECGVRVVPADAIVIERAEMPPVTSDASNVWTTNGYQAEARLRGCNVANLRARALSLLALAEYLDAHPPTPPVDEADVEALAGDLFAARWPGMDWNLRADPQQQDYRTMARTLIADGWAKR